MLSEIIVLNNPKFLHSNRPLSSTDLRVFWRNDIPPILSIDQLRNKRVALMRGYHYTEATKLIINDETANEYFVVVNDHEAALAMLDKKRVDYLLGYWHVLEHVKAKELGLQLGNLKLDTFDIYFAILKTHPLAEQTMNKLNTAMDELGINTQHSKKN